MSEGFASVKNIYENDAELKEEQVKVLKEWVEAQPHLPQIQELQLLLFYHSCYYDVEAAKKCIDRYYTMRSTIPAIFSDRNVFSEELQAQLQISLLTILPKTTPEDYLVFYSRLIDTVARKYHHGPQVKIMDMVIQLTLLQVGPKPGFVQILDMAGSTFGHSFRVNLLLLKQTVNYAQEALPVRMKTIHIINANTITATFINLVKSLMKRHLRDLIHVHSNLDSLHKEIPKEILPMESGGQAGTIKDLRDAQIRNLENHADFFLEDEKCKTDESKRVAH